MLLSSLPREHLLKDEPSPASRLSKNKQKEPKGLQGGAGTPRCLTYEQESGVGPTIEGTCSKSASEDVGGSFS